ncbi:MAG: hypothetical protein IIU58_03350 [Clostridia bacterium]|nr:hypothetical protein [Clostridia bacterium]
MKIDKNLLEQLANLDDRSLTAAIRMIAASSGMDLSGTSFDRAGLDALRNAMRGATDADIANAKSILEGYSKQ